MCAEIILIVVLLLLKFVVSVIEKQNKPRFSKFATTLYVPQHCCTVQHNNNAVARLQHSLCGKILRASRVLDIQPSRDISDLTSAFLYLVTAYIYIIFRNLRGCVEKAYFVHVILVKFANISKSYSVVRKMSDPATTNQFHIAQNMQNFTKIGFSSVSKFIAIIVSKHCRPCRRMMSI